MPEPMGLRPSGSERVRMFRQHPCPLAVTRKDLTAIADLTGAEQVVAAFVPLMDRALQTHPQADLPKF